MTAFDLGQEGNAFSFDELGDSVTGRVVNLEEIQSTDMDTGEPEFWPNGQPKMMYRLTLQTELREGDGDDGVRAIYLRGRRKPNEDGTMSSLCACLQAVKKATGTTQIQAGGIYTHTWTSNGVPTRKGWNPPKWYEGSYVPPQMNLDSSEPAAVSAPYANTAAANAATTVKPQAAVAAAVQADPSDPWAVVIGSGKYTADQITAMRAANIDPAKL